MEEKYLPYKNVHRLMKTCTDQKIGKDSVEQTIIFLETLTKDIISLSTMYSKHDKRRIINSKDINLAIKTLQNVTYDGV